MFNSNAIFSDITFEYRLRYRASVNQDAQVTAATSGNGTLVFGDNTGNVHLVNRTYDVITFRAYDLTLTLAQQVQHSTFLFTIGVSIILLLQIYYKDISY